MRTEVSREFGRYMEPGEVFLRGTDASCQQAKEPKEPTPKALRKRAARIEKQQKAERKATKACKKREKANRKARENLRITARDALVRVAEDTSKGYASVEAVRTLNELGWL